MAENTAQVSKVIHANPSEIWKALTTPALLKSYFMGANVVSDFKVGSPITFSGEFKGRPYEDKGQIQTVEPEKKLAFSHFSPLSGQPDAPENYHLVTFDLAPTKGGGTQVTLTQANLMGGVKPSDENQRAEYEKNWTGVLDGLQRVVEKQ
jgi:uncharacterized protein YndB with AHSA1/START domain